MNVIGTEAAARKSPRTPDGAPARPGRGARIFRWAKLASAALLALAAALLVAGLSYQAVSSEADGRRYPPPGELVDVGGYRMHVDVSGEDRGGPTVILDAGSGSASFQWGWVRPEVAEGARVVAYDRPGTGWSEEPPKQLDARQSAEDLREALGKLGMEGPYVVVGHSMGSLTARAFAEAYPGEVAGAVLVDPRGLSLHEDFPEEFPERSVPADPPLAVRLQGVAAKLGVVRALDPLGDYAAQLPDRQEGEARAYVASDKPHAGMWHDVRLAESAAPTLRDGEHLRKKPLVVLSAGEPDAMNFPPGDRREFTAMHARMAEELSEHGEHRVVEGADHLSVVTDRGHALRVAGAIRRVVGAAGAGEGPSR